MSFGSDIWCQDSLFTGRYARGVTVVVQALYRRLITPRGTLRGGPEESAYGIDLAEYVGSVGADLALASLPGVIAGELSKDDRVANVSAIVSREIDSAGLVYLQAEISCTLRDADADFAFTIAVNDVTVTLLGGIS